MTVRLADVIQPDVFSSYTVQQTTEKSALIQSGIVQNDPEFDTLASGPNSLIDMPYWTDLEGDSEVVNDDNFLTPGKIGTNADKAKKHVRARAWGANALSGFLAGSDPMDKISGLVSSYWVREMQKILLVTLKGVFASASMASHVYDISEADTTNNVDAQKLEGASFVDATQLLGDAKDILTGVMMHSAVEAYLVKRQLIEYVNVTNELNQTIKIPYFMGKQVIVDDAMPFDTQSLTAEMYLFGNGAIGLGNGSHPNILQTEVDRDSMSAAGEDFLINRKIFIMHPRGIKWTDNTIEKQFPTNAEIANGANWQLVYDHKKIRIVKFKFKITA